MGPDEQLRKLLAPAGGGVPLFSTGLLESRALQRRVYGVARDEGITKAHHGVLRSVSEAKAYVLGVPSDCGAGFVRGANQGPFGIRRHLLSEEAEHAYFADGIVDVGDIRCVPHFLSEEMLSEAQKRESAEALYGEECGDLPVTPLAQTERALSHLGGMAPDAVPIVVGGDHSVAWPAFLVAHRRAEKRGKRLGLLHFDAHTDLLPHRLGVRYCFATWAYHANELLGRDGRLIQIGIRASGRDKAHWEQSLGVRQVWPEEYLRKSASELAGEVIADFRARGVDAVYVSNDIDGTDEIFARATGTPESLGLHPDMVSTITRAVCGAFPLFGADLVEVAPPLARDGDRTLSTAARYLGDFFDMALASSST